MVDKTILDTPRLRVRQSRLASCCLIGFWPGREAAFARHLESAVGSPLPQGGRQCAKWDAGRAYRVHPQKLLLASTVDPDLFARLAAGFEADLGTLSEQSHSRVLVEVSGSQAASLMQHGLPMDPAHSLADLGSFVQTRLKDANLLVCRTGPQCFEMLVPTSFSKAVEKWITRTVKDVII